MRPRRLTGQDTSASSLLCSPKETRGAPECFHHPSPWPLPMLWVVHRHCPLTSSSRPRSLDSEQTRGDKLPSPPTGGPHCQASPPRSLASHLLGISWVLQTTRKAQSIPEPIQDSLCPGTFQRQRTPQAPREMRDSLLLQGADSLQPDQQRPALSKTNSGV